MSDKKLRELERQLRKEPANLALRLQLAALYHQLGRTGDAVEQYRAVALAYRDDGRIQQAVAVARSALAVAPHDAELRRLVDSGTSRTASDGGRAASDSGRAASPDRVVDGAGSAPPGVRVLESAVAVREIAPMRTGAVVTVQRVRGSEPIETPSHRTPSGLYTPTPLPIPLAYHDADPSKIRGLGKLLVDDEDDARTGGGGSGVGDGGDTIPESPTEGLHKAARRISEQLIAMSPGIPVAPLEGDDLSAELETRRRPKIDATVLDQLGIPPTGQLPKLEPEDHEDEPTRPPPRDRGSSQHAVARPDDDAWSEEPTDLRRSGGPLEPPPRRGGVVFDQPLAETVAAFAPDGSALSPGGFGALPDVVRQRLVAAGEVRTLAAGTIVVREGEVGESLFVIESGEVRVLKRLAGRPPEIARLGAGAIVGEIAVMTDRRRHATVETVNAVRVVEIPRSAVVATTADHPALGRMLDALVRERLLSNLMAIAPFFGSLAAEARAAVLSRFRPRKVATGGTVIEQGQPATGLFLVVLGAVELSVRRADGRTVRVATVGEGGHVGELALMTDGPEPASATAIGPADLICLAAREFYAVVADEPSLWTALRGEAERRSAEVTKAHGVP